MWGASRRRNPAPMVAPRHPAHHARLVGAVLAGHPLGPSACASSALADPAGCLVCQIDGFLLGFAGPGATQSVGPSDFFTLALAPRERKSLACRARALCRRAFL